MGLLVEVSIPKQDQRADYDTLVDSELAELAARREYDAVIDEANEAGASEVERLRDALVNVRNWVVYRQVAVPGTPAPTCDELIGQIDGVLARYGG